MSARNLPHLAKRMRWAARIICLIVTVFGATMLIGEAVTEFISQGSISVIGFERGLKEWRRFLKPNGFLVVHDEIGNITEKLEQISSCGYELLEYFTLGEDTWWIEYYAPLEKRINEIRAKYADGPKALVALDNDQREIDMFKKNPRRYGSVFFIMKKR